MFVVNFRFFPYNSVKVCPIKLKIDMLHFLDICQCAFKLFVSSNFLMSVVSLISSNTLCSIWSSAIKYAGLTFLSNYVYISNKMNRQIFNIYFLDMCFVYTHNHQALKFLTHVLLQICYYRTKIINAFNNYNINIAKSRLQHRQIITQAFEI